MQGRVDFSADLILVCNSLDAGGIERVVSTLANTWSRQGRKVCVVTLHDRRRFYALDSAVHHVVVDRAGLTWLAEFLKRLKSRLQELRQAKPLLVAILGGPLYHLFSENLYQINFQLFLDYEAWTLRRALRRVESPVVVAFGTAINIITLRACMGMGRRVIISERNDPERLLRIKMWDRMSRRLYRYADLVTANTQSALRSMTSFVEPRKMAFVPNPLAPPNGHGDARSLPDSPCVLIVGRLVWDKAHDVLLDAFALLGDELREWRLAVVGDGRLKGTLQKQAEGLGIAGRVDWYGVVSDPHAFYRAASVFVLPSRVEGMPNALLEAMSCGLPVVVSDGTPGPLELVEDDVTGLVVPVNDDAALAAALHRLACDAALRRRLGEAARARVSEYELPRALAAWESVIGLNHSDTFTARGLK
jgi:glycosyltransferase involved in cell wall biosynthesis